MPDDRSIKVFENQNKFQSVKSQKDEAKFLYKIHGDYENPDTIVLFDSDYKEIYDKSNHNQDALKNFFKGKTLLFIGFSLSDPFVNDLFSNVKEMYGGFSVNKHFAFTTKNESFAKYDVEAIKLDDWDESLLEYLLELKNVKNKSVVIHSEKKNVESNNDYNDDLADLNLIYELINKKTNDLRKDRNNVKLYSEILDLRGKVDKLLFKEIDFLQEIKGYVNTELQALYTSVYSLEVFDDKVFERINNVRANHEKFQWYDRSVILSAVTCNIIHFNRADYRKISVLIDFINDNEDKVWQKAITYLFVVLNHLGNKWLRYTELKNKLESLKQNPKIQNACIKIIDVFNIGFHNVALPSNIFENNYFKDNSFNYFLPFFIDNENEGFLSIYENYEGGDVDEFIEFLKDIPIPDQMKYFLCNSKENNSKKEGKGKKKKTDLDKLKNILLLNKVFYPYSIYIQEIVSFYKFFPELKHAEILNSQLKITQTPIKEYLLNEVEKSKALAFHFIKEKQWGQAVVNIKQAINLKGKDIELLHYLKVCYKESKDVDNELIISEEIYGINNKDEENICELISLYKNKKNYSKAMQFASELIIINDKKAMYFYNRAVIYKAQSKYDKAILDCNMGISIDSEELELYDLRSICYYEIGDNDNSIKDCDFLIKRKENEPKYYCTRALNFISLMKYEDALQNCDYAIKLDSKASEIYHIRALIFRDLKEYAKALDECNKFIRLDLNNVDYYCDRAFIYLCNNNFKAAMQDIKRAEKIDLNNPRVYGCYANYYRLLKDYQKAIDYINKAICNDVSNSSLFIGIKAEIYGSMDDDENFF
ncbi:MAG: hypothetical protein E2604_12560, partial [Flavobacterium sp.]|nr:hypothetical protein [Flavobacterium sp.]